MIADIPPAVRGRKLLPRQGTPERLAMSVTTPRRSYNHLDLCGVAALGERARTASPCESGLAGTYISPAGAPRSADGGIHAWSWIRGGASRALTWSGTRPPVMAGARSARTHLYAANESQRHAPVPDGSAYSIESRYRRCAGSTPCSEGAGRPTCILRWARARSPLRRLDGRGLTISRRAGSVPRPRQRHQGGPAGTAGIRLPGAFAISWPDPPSAHDSRPTPPSVRFAASSADQILVGDSTRNAR